MDCVKANESKEIIMKSQIFKPVEMLELTDKDFKKLSKLIYDRFGINLTEQKRALLMGRLNKVVRTMGFTNYREYFEYVVNDKTNESLLKLVDKISTNHTFFFRGKDHFDFLSDTVLPELDNMFSDNTELRIWSAGCSSGAETFTIAMILKEYYVKTLFKEIGMLGTDISMTALDQASKGIYPVEYISEAPVYYKNKYFNMIGNGQVRIEDAVKKMVLFKRLNLMNAVYPFKSKFHIIFCRNVMIYFDSETRRNLVNKFYNYLHPGGYLFIGHSETLSRKASPFTYLKPAIYRKV